MKRCYKCGIEKLESEFRKDSSKSSGLQSKCRICDNQRTKENFKRKRKENPEFKKRVNRNSEIGRQKRELIDPVFKLKRKMRSSLRGAFKRMGYSKNTLSQEILGADWEIVKEHFESLFTEGMTWENMGKWHIDHKIPLSTATSEQEIKTLCNYKNLQPLWEKDNLEKSDKII
jgi:hypothetical protein